MEGQTNPPDPGFTPYYDKKFFLLIKDIKENSPLNPLHLTIKQWYKLLVENSVTKREIDQEGRQELIPCKVEERDPAVTWNESYRISRLKGLSPDNKSFLFKLIHTLLPSRERINHLSPTASPQCWCGSGEDETYQHLFFNCPKNQVAGQALLKCVRCYDQNLTEQKSLQLDMLGDDPFLLSSIVLLSAGLELIWNRRKVQKSTALFDMRAELELAVTIRRRSRSKAIREAVDIMHNMIANFFG